MAVFSICLLWKDYPYGSWQNHQPNPVEVLKEGCRMIIKGIKDLIKTIKIESFTINIGFIGLNFAGGFSKGNI
jgi:hypothetical protein